LHRQKCPNVLKKNNTGSREWKYMPVISATQEVEVDKILTLGQTGHKFSKILISTVIQAWW
jgi:hypothetical protein